MTAVRAYAAQGGNLVPIDGGTANSGVWAARGGALVPVAVYAARDGSLGVSDTSAYDAAILAAGPELYLPLGPGGMTDRTSHGHLVSVAGRPSAALFPTGDSASVFDGAAQYVEVAAHAALSVPNTGILTVEAWIRPDNLQPPHLEGSGYVYFMGRNMPGQSEYSSRFYALTNDENRPNRISGYAFNLSGGLGTGSYFQDTVTAGQWIHYVLVINTVDVSSTYPTGYTKIFKNGVFRDQDALSDYSIVPQAGTAPLRIGTATLDSFFPGAIAKVAVYGRELTTFEVRDHYQLAVPPVAGSASWIKNVGSATSKTSGTKLAITVPAGGVSAGSTLLVRVAHSYTSGGPTMADSKGNTYTRDQTSPNAATTMRASLFRGTINNALQEGDVIQLTTSAAAAVRVMVVDEFAHLTYSSPLDVINSASSAGSTTPGGTIPITTTNPDDLLIGVVAVIGDTGQTYTEDTLRQWSSLTRAGTTGGGDMTVNSAFKSVGTAGSQSYQPTLGTSAPWIEIIAAYKAGIPTITPTPGGSARYVQSFSATSKTAGTTLAIPAPAGGVPAGHTLIVRVSADYTTSAPLVTDNRGNTYTRDRSAANAGTTMRAAVFSCRVTTALQAGDTISVLFPAAVTAKAAAADQFSGVMSPITLDTQNGLTGTSTAPSIPVTTTNADDLLVAMVAVEGPSSEGFTEDVFDQWSGAGRAGTTGGTATSNKTINGAYRAVGVTGTYTYAPVLGTSESWVGFVMAYKAA